MLTTLCRWVIIWGLIGSSFLNASTPHSLHIVATPFSPFVIQQQTSLEGFSIDLWKRIASICQFDYTIQLEPSIPAMYQTLREKKADVGIGGFPILLAHERYINYTYPVFKSGSMILTLYNNQDSLLGNYSSRFFRIFISKDIIKVLCLLFILLFLSANIVWFAERKKNPDMFPKKYIQGLWESFWWSSVTITTVGYGDKTPKSLIGRICALIWMFAGIFIISYFTATISSSNTVSELQNKYNTPHDLIGKQVGTVKGNSITRYLKVIGVRVFEFDTIDRAYEALNRNLITAVVFEAPVLQYFVKQNQNKSYILNTHTFKEQYYGFVLASDSPYQESINRAIIFLQETGEYDLIYEKWFGS